MSIHTYTYVAILLQQGERYVWETLKLWTWKAIECCKSSLMAPLVGAWTTVVLRAAWTMEAKVKTFLRLWWFEIPSIVSYAQAFEYLASSWWCCLGRLRRFGLAGGCTLLRVSFKISKPTCHSQFAVCSLNTVWYMSPQFLLQPSCLLLVAVFPYYDGLWSHCNCKGNKPFFKLFGQSVLS